MKDKPKYKELPLNIVVAAQQAYMAQQQAPQPQQAKPAQLGLNPGWGGKGR